MRAGLLRNKIIIQSPTESRDTIGGVTKTWATFAEAWASIEPISQREFDRSDQTRADASHKIVIRFVSGVLPTFRVAWTVSGTTRYFNIVGIANTDERSKTITLMAMEAL